MFRLKKRRVLVLSDYWCATGFATVMTNILRQVKKYFGNTVQFDIVAINWYGDYLPDDYQVQPSEAADIREVDELVDDKLKKVKKRITIREVDGTTVYSAYYHDGREDVFGRNAFLSFLNHIDYNMVFVLQDIGVVSGVLQVIRKIREDHLRLTRKKKKFKVLYYFPKDSNAMLPGWFEDFHVADKLVAYTEYAKKFALRGNPSLESKNIAVIYHGVDTSCFKRLDVEDVIEFRKAFFGENAKKFIVSNVNRNQFRKDIPSTIMAFDLYRKTCNKNSFLYLHMNPDDIQGWQLRTIMQQTELIEYEDYMFMPLALIKTPPDPEFVNLIYNASDVYITTTMGEGFGLTILEAMMAKCPVIAPYHTSIVELAGSAGKRRIISIKAGQEQVSRFDNIIRPQVDREEAAYAISRAYKNPGFIETITLEAHLFARELSWNTIGKKWVEEFKKLL